MVTMDDLYSNPIYLSSFSILFSEICILNQECEMILLLLASIQINMKRFAVTFSCVKIRSELGCSKSY